MVHGDDFVSSGTREHLQWLRSKLEQRFEMKTTVIDHRQGEAKEGRILNRVHGWEYEEDQRHSDLLVKTLKLEDANPHQGEDPKKEREQEESQLLEGGKITAYRQLAARANYMAQDWPDIQFAVKELCRWMAMPIVGAWKQLKPLERHAKEGPRVVLKFGFQERTSISDGSSDSDWAGCRQTARSTCGGVLMIRNHMLKSWSSTQRTVTLSSAEAELVATVKLFGESIGLTQLAAAGRIPLVGHVHVESSAVIGIANRKGNGKLRHVKVGTLWIQELVEDEEIILRKVEGENNVADILTKNVGVATLDKHAESMSMIFPLG